MPAEPERAPPAALSGRPEAKAFSVEDLVAQVRAGRVRIPRFQRPLKWVLPDVLSLLDSIYLGYPIGTLLLWQRPAEAERIVHGSVVVDAPKIAEALWVVDGQQRIVSLARTLIGGGYPDEPFASFFDLKTLRFVRPKQREAPPAHYLPMTDALDSERLLEWLLAQGTLGEDRKAAIRVGKRLREYQVPAYIVTTNDERAVREIFRRANNTGKRMDDSDVFNALNSAGGSPPNLRDVAERLLGLGFGRLEESTLLKMLQATLGTDPSKAGVPELDPATASMVMDSFLECVRATVLFVQMEARIPYISLLPYQQPLFALARFFHRHPRPHPRSCELLARWLWRGALTGSHNGNNVTDRQILAKIGDDEHGAVQALLAMLPGRPAPDDELGTFLFQAARCKIQLLALLELGPRDLRSGQPIARPGESGSDEADGYQGLIRVVSAHHENSLANRIVHPGVRTGVIRAIVDCDDRDSLASHAIGVEARRALKFDDVPKFLRLRGSELRGIVARFGDGRAEWDEVDSPPIEALRIAGPRR